MYFIKSVRIERQSVSLVEPGGATTLPASHAQPFLKFRHAALLNSVWASLEIRSQEPIILSLHHAILCILKQLSL